MSDVPLGPLTKLTVLGSSHPVAGQGTQHVTETGDDPRSRHEEGGYRRRRASSRAASRRCYRQRRRPSRRPPSRPRRGPWRLARVARPTHRGTRPRKTGRGGDARPQREHRQTLERLASVLPRSDHPGHGAQLAQAFDEKRGQVAGPKRGYGPEDSAFARGGALR